jgi:hypothetical protein
MIDQIHRETGHPIRPICKVLCVPRSSYYHAATPTATAVKDQTTGARIEQIFRKHRRRYGYRRIYEDLNFQGTGYLLGKPVPWNHFKFKRSARRREGRRMGAGESDSFGPIPLSHSFVPIPLSRSFVPFLCPISFVPFPLSHFLCPDSSKAVMRHFVPRSCG